MFKIIYSLTGLSTLLGLTIHNYPMALAAFIALIITFAWNQDHAELKRIQSITSDPDIHNNQDYLKKHQVFKNLSLSQKLIYATAFKSGIEFILNKLS